MCRQPESCAKGLDFEPQPYSQRHSVAVGRVGVSILALFKLNSDLELAEDFAYYIICIITCYVLHTIEWGIYIIYVVS